MVTESRHERYLFTIKGRIMRKTGLILVCLAALVVSGFTQGYNPPAGGEDLFRFFSPRFLADGESAVSMRSPEADAVNPAASGALQRPTLDLSYLGIADFGPGTGYGQAVNLGASLPTRAGVLTGSLHMLAAPFQDELSLGTLGSLHVSFAKDLFPNLLVGAGAHMTYGTRSGTTDWGAGLDLGFIHCAGDLWRLKDFRWGGVLRNIGKGYNPHSASGESSFPAVFTPAFGASFTALRTGSLELSVTGDLSFPSFQNVRFKLGTELTVRDLLSFETSLHMDAHDLSAPPSQSMVPSFGLSVNLGKLTAGKDGGKPGAAEVSVETGVSKLYRDIWAFGAGVNVPLGNLDTRPPVITVTYPEVQYVSPNHDGVHDYLEFPLSITDERFIKGFRFLVTDRYGVTIREIRNKEERPENSSIGNLLDRLVYVKTGIPVPGTLRWDGTGDAGSLPEDGTYSFILESWDDNGNTGRTPVMNVVLDTEAPRVEISGPADPAALIFSPNGDGNKDTLLISQSGSREELWEGRILDAAGTVVKSFVWKNEAPGSFPWDGKNLEGTLAPDGVYSYVVASTDRAGNTTERRLDNIIINTQAPPISLTIDSAWFSPNGDGVKDTVSLVPEVPVTAGIMNWGLTVKNERGQIVHTLIGGERHSSEVPEPVVFDGIDDAGKPLPEGRYRAELTALYQNGHRPSAESPVFTVDVTAPSALVRADHRVFSPNGDGRKETVTLYHETSREEQWEGVILDPDGAIVRTFIWTETADASTVWDGRADDRMIVPDGTYRYTVSSIDRAGNRGVSERLELTVDRRETPIALSTQDEAFSPNGDGLKDSLEVFPQIQVTDSIERMTLSIHREDGTAVRTQRASRKELVSFAWDGLDDSGTRMPNGGYYAQLSVTYLNGNEPVTRTGMFLLDNAAPKAEVRANYAVFSPNGDGSKDEIAFAQETSKEARWIGTITDTQNRVVKSFSWIGEADRNVTWDGRGDDKLVQRDGRYTYRLQSIDLAGNKGSAAPILFEINTEETPLFLSAEFDAFSPNGDGVKDTVRLLPQLKVKDGIQSSRLAILDRAGRTIRTYEGTPGTEPSFTWDGTTDTGVKASDGPYTAQISLMYENGNAPEAKTSPFVLDTAAPAAKVSVDYRVFSPNGDGNKDLLTIAQETTSEETWTGTVFASDGKPVKLFTWSGTAEPRLFWDGRGNDKSVAPDGSYTYRLTALDDAGNRGISEEVRFTIDTTETPVFVSNEYPAFSPNGDGVQDDLNLLTQAKVDRGVERWDLRILDNAGGAVRRFAGAAKLSPSVSWNGRNDAGKPVTDGRYAAVFTVWYENGNVSSARIENLVLDTVAPEIRITPDHTLFSPNGDGFKDAVAITQLSSVEELWEGSIVTDKGEAVVSASWKGSAKTMMWDGRDRSGNRVRDGRYRYVVSAQDAAGNRIERSSEPITLDTRSASVFVTASGNGFSPNGDGRADEISFSMIVNLADGIESWKLALADETGTIRKTLSGEGLPPARLVWNGIDDDGRITEGLYTATFVVVYRKGDRPQAVTRGFLLDVSPPVSGVELVPTLFSPDNDGVDDEISIGLSVRDRSIVESWRFEILDPVGRTFTVFEGRGMPSDRIIWDGRSQAAELVQAAEDYPYVFTVTDAFGNMGKKTGKIPVDVLVIREGDRLKIRISSITFPAYRADLVWADHDASDKNLKILTRLGEILNKYSSYRVRIEGHAVSEYWQNAAQAAREETEELQPLSLKRAEAVQRMLADLGVDAARLSTLGLGGKEPVVPHSDLENRWKNRRVEFILLK